MKKGILLKRMLNLAQPALDRACFQAAVSFSGSTNDAELLCWVCGARGSVRSSAKEEPAGRSLGGI